MPEIKWNVDFRGACKIRRLSNRENQWRIELLLGQLFPKTAWKWKRLDGEGGPFPDAPFDSPVKIQKFWSTLVRLLSIFRLLFLSPLFLISKKIFTRILKYGGTLSLLGLPTLFCLKFFGFKIGCETRLNPSRVFRLQTALKETIWFNSPKSSHLNGIYFNQTVWSLIQESILVRCQPPACQL